MAFNIVELATAGSEDCACDQRCRFGHRVESHAVYCHNDNWDDSPRKCRRSWYTAGEIRDEDCAGFESNPEFKGDLQRTLAAEPYCSRCKGAKLIPTSRQGRTETCPLCMGSGSQPAAMALTPYEEDTLSLERTLRGNRGAVGRGFVRIAESRQECESVSKLAKLGLVVIRSLSFAKEASVYLLENTLKGEAVLVANWELRRKS